MRYRRPRIVGMAAIVLGFLASVAVYPDLPVEMADHWGVGGGVNGSSP